MEGVVFDLDGVIADSMGQHVLAYREVLAPLGIPVEDRAVLLLEGARSETIISDLATAAGVSDIDVATLAKEKQAAFLRRGWPALYPGAAAVVRAMAEQVPVAIVTGTRRENLDVLIPDLLPILSASMCQEDYTQDKPHPEPYARAAELLDIDPENLVAVENAPRGVASATAAGYGCVVGITTTVSADDLAQADHVVKDHEALAATLQTLAGVTP